MLKQNGSVASTVIVMPVVLSVILMIVALVMYSKNQLYLNQTAKYSMRYWSTNVSDDCSNVESWLINNAIAPKLNSFGINISDVTITTAYPANCNCPGAELSLTMTLNNSTINSWFKTDLPIVVNTKAIKEGPENESC